LRAICWVAIDCSSMAPEMALLNGRRISASMPAPQPMGACSISARRAACNRVRRLLAGLVQRLQARGFSGPVYPLPLRQLHMADATGLTPVHIGRILGEMRHNGLLDQTQGRLTLHDADWLLGAAR
jgi:CRP-like cAMP-binding protein